ncbi:MAG: biotin carboxylase, partial [Sphingobacteriales bacterium]
VELRVYAEDPANNFLPDIGTLQTYITPKGPGVRVDDGFEQGMEIPIYYDPMIAKLITYGKDRAEAIDRMKRAIDEYHITGITTTLGFGRFVMNHEAFTSGNFDTHFVKKYFNPDVLTIADEDEAFIATIVMEKLLNTGKGSQGTPAVVAETSNWVKNRKNLS